MESGDQIEIDEGQNFSKGPPLFFNFLRHKKAHEFIFMLNLYKNYEIMYFLLDLAAFSNLVLSFI